MTRYQLFEIWNYIAEDSPESADRVEQAIFAARETLAGSPLIGVIRADLRSAANSRH